jgi:hypothetical protein
MIEIALKPIRPGSIAIEVNIRPTEIIPRVFVINTIPITISRSGDITVTVAVAFQRIVSIL